MPARQQGTVMALHNRQPCSLQAAQLLLLTCRPCVAFCLPCTGRLVSHYTPHSEMILRLVWRLLKCGERLCAPLISWKCNLDVCQTTAMDPVFGGILNVHRIPKSIRRTTDYLVARLFLFPIIGEMDALVAQIATLPEASDRNLQTSCEHGPSLTASHYPRRHKTALG